jgi:uncharacterized protein YegJ (DUF2314 family)
MFFRGFCCAFVAVILLGCKGEGRPTGTRVKRAGQPDVAYVDDADPKMKAAIDRARTTADQFIQALARAEPSQQGFSVKLLVQDGSRGEHMWITPVRFANGNFSGELNNVPDTLTNVKLGDEVSVSKNEISDWMYIDNGKLVGGYTLRVLRDAMSADERADFDRNIPFKIE